jgi:hypothetical protein
MTPKFLAAVAASLMLLSPPSLAANVNIQVVPTPATLQAGGTSFVDLIATYDGADVLLGGAISLTFRADMFEVVNVTLQAPSDISGSIGTVQIAGQNGTVSSIGFASFEGIGGTFNLATIEFRSLGPTGISPLMAFDPAGPVFVWVNASLEPVSVTSTPSSLVVSAVPEPRTAGLWLVGVGAIAMATRRRRLWVSQP